MSRWVWSALAAGVLVFAAGDSAGAQGCAQCRDAVQSTPVRQQHAYRGAISMLAGAAVLVCSGAAVALGQRR